MAAQTADGVPISDGFDFPVGPRERNTDVFKTHKIDTVLADPAYFEHFKVWHPGEDWNGRGGGDTDLDDPIYAISNGRVVEQGFFPIWGNIVLLEHVLPNGRRVWSQYAHLNKILVDRIGQTVNRGQQIGTMGKGADNRYLAHLHFEIRKKRLPAGNWSPMVKDRAAVLANYYSPTDFIKSHGPGSLVPQRVAVPTQVIVGPTPGNAKVGIFQQGGAGAWQSTSGGYGSNFLSVPTTTGAETHWGQWQPNLPAGGLWDVWVHIPAQNATTTYARYVVTHASGQTEIPINQLGNANSWAILGQFRFEPGRAAVRLGNLTGEFGPPRRVAFDTVCWTQM